MKEISSILFDLDGVICSTDEYHYQAWKRIADELEIPFDRTVNNRLRGVSRMESLEILLEKNQGEPFSEEEKQSLAADKNEIYRELLGQMSKKDLSGEVKETLDLLRERGFLLAIGSSSKNTPFILERIGLQGYFDAVSDGNNISRSKPDPEVFLKAAQMLNVSPSECLVVEDAVSGVQAGHAAGMKVAAVGDASLKGAGDYNLRSFAELADLPLLSQAREKGRQSSKTASRFEEHRDKFPADSRQGQRQGGSGYACHL